MPKDGDFTEFELYVMKRLDNIDAKVSKLNIQMVKGASFWGGLTGIIISAIGWGLTLYVNQPPVH